MPERARRRPKIFLVCSGLGTIQRGYESFMHDLFGVLSAEGSLDVRLFKGAGPSLPSDRALPNLRRAGMGARVLGALSGRGPYIVEQVTFTAGLLPYLSREQPDVVLFPDPAIGKCLWAWRRIFGGRFRLVLHNGGPHPAPFPWFDHVHQVTPSAMAEAVRRGHDPARQTLIPSGIHLGPPPETLPPEQKAALRRGLRLPEDRPVVLSVGALNRGHKRMDCLIDEIASLPEPRPFLVMLGQEESETPALRDVADRRLGAGGYFMGQVTRDKVSLYYRAADLFVLASLTEGFGLVLAEALAQGLPVITHDYAVSRYVLGTEGRLADLAEAGALAREVADALARPDDSGARARRYASVEQRFGWPRLTPDYVAMLRSCALSPAPGRAPPRRFRLVARAGAPPAEA